MSKKIACSVLAALAVACGAAYAASEMPQNSGSDEAFREKIAKVISPAENLPEAKTDSMAESQQDKTTTLEKIGALHIPFDDMFKARKAYEKSMQIKSDPHLISAIYNKKSFSNHPFDDYDVDYKLTLTCKTRDCQSESFNKTVRGKSHSGTYSTYESNETSPYVTDADSTGRDIYSRANLGTKIRVLPIVHLGKGLVFNIEAQYTFERYNGSSYPTIKTYKVRQSATMRRDDNNQIKPLIIDTDDFSLKIEAGIN